MPIVDEAIIDLDKSEEKKKSEVPRDISNAEKIPDFEQKYQVLKAELRKKEADAEQTAHKLLDAEKQIKSLQESNTNLVQNTAQLRAEITCLTEECQNLEAQNKRTR